MKLKYILFGVFSLIFTFLIGCKGGVSLGKGSAGTVVTPKTPQEINESSIPKGNSITPKVNVEPVDLPQPIESKPVNLPPARVKPTIPPIESATPDKFPSTPIKPVDNLKPILPTVNRNSPPYQVEMELPTRGSVTPLPASTPDNSSGNNSKANQESDNKITFNWGEAISWWMVALMIFIIIWVLSDIGKSIAKRKEEEKKSRQTPKPAKKRRPAKKSAKKTASKAPKKATKKAAPKKSTKKK